MNSKQLYNRVVDARVCHRPSDVKDAFKEYHLSHCYHPQRIRCYDPYLGKFVEKEVACGHCYHCRETKQNEWVTRMYAHLEHFKNAYFITLTYTNFYVHPNSRKMSQQDRLVFNHLRGAMYHYDSDNYDKTPCFAPCVLCKSHYQKFLKRLRRNTGLTDITYVLCGEYGHTYGRPHYHAVIFTNGVLTKDDIDVAWSVSLCRDERGNYQYYSPSVGGEPLRFSFGRTDFADLVANGTITQQQIMVDGKKMSGEKCFAYVCKYLSKDEFNDSRVRIAYPYNVDILNNANYFENEICPYNFDDFLSEGIQFLSRSTLSVQKDAQSPIVGVDFYPAYGNDWDTFRAYFRPFMQCSRGNAIGSLYVKTHIDQMAQGVFAKSSLQESCYVVPAYFRRKAAEYVCAIRQRSQHNNFAMGDLPSLVQNLKSLTLGVSPHIKCTTYNKDFEKSNRWVKNFAPLRDVCTHEYFVIYHMPNTIDYWVQGFKYDRSKHDYVKTRKIDIYVFCAYYLHQLDAAYLAYEQSQEIAFINQDYLCAALAEIDAMHFPDDFSKSVVESIEKNNALFFDQQKKIKKQKCPDKL